MYRITFKFDSFFGLSMYKNGNDSLHDPLMIIGIKGMRKRQNEKCIAKPHEKCEMYSGSPPVLHPIPPGLRALYYGLNL